MEAKTDQTEEGGGKWSSCWGEEGDLVQRFSHQSPKVNSLIFLFERKSPQCAAT